MWLHTVYEDGLHLNGAGVRILVKTLNQCLCSIMGSMLPQGAVVEGCGRSPI